MKLKNHITVSLIFSAFLFAISKSWTIFTSSLISGVLIDCDHILDYLWSYRKRFRVKEFLNTCYCEKDYKCGVIFHSWELLAILSICASLMSWDPWIVGLTIGFAQHIVLDQIFNKTNRLTYFFFWRMKNRFNLKKIFPN